MGGADGADGAGYPGRLDAFREGGGVNVVVEAPAGTRNKYKFEPEVGAFMLDKALPAGAVFPFDFGFVPGTLADDGDPLDVLVILDQSTFAGCLVPARLLGIIRARQKRHDGSEEDNPRLVAVGAHSRDHGDLQSLDDLPDAVITEIEHFFASYHALDGTEFRPTGRGGPEEARAIVEAGRAARKNVRHEAS